MAVRLFLDFDGTIATVDVGDELVRTFGTFQPLHSELLRGDFSVAEYYRRAVHSFGPNRTPEEFTAWALTQDLDPGFVPLVSWATANGIDVSVVSDGFDVYIRPLLDRAGVLSSVRLACNLLTVQDGRATPAFPGATESCSCFCASCKRNAVIAHLADDDVVVYVGDGRSDACAVAYADVVFAKGTLAAVCTRDGIPHHHYRTLSEVLIVLRAKYADGTLRPRRQAILARKRAFEAE